MSSFLISFVKKKSFRVAFSLFVFAVVGFTSFKLGNLSDSVRVAIVVRDNGVFSKMTKEALSIKLGEYQKTHGPMLMIEYELGDYLGDVSSLYEDISAGNFDIVIDNLWGVEFMKALDVIKKENLRVISLNADYLSDDAKVIYLGSDHLNFKPIVDYIIKILKVLPKLHTSQVTLIGEKYEGGGDYAESVRIRNALNELMSGKEDGLDNAEILEVSCYQSKFKEHPDRAVVTLSGELAKVHGLLSDSGSIKKGSGKIFVLALHGEIGGLVVDLISRNYSDSIIIGGQSNVNEVSDELVDRLDEQGNRLILLQKPYDQVTVRERDLLIKMKKRESIAGFLKDSPERGLIVSERINVAYDLILAELSKQHRGILFRSITDSESFTYNDRKYNFSSQGVLLRSPTFGEYRALDYSEERLASETDNVKFVSAEYQLPRDYWSKVSGLASDVLTEQDFHFYSNLYLDVQMLNIYSISESSMVFSADVSISVFSRINHLDSSSLYDSFPDLDIVWDGAKYVFISRGGAGTTKAVDFPSWLHFTNAHRVDKAPGRATLSGDYMRVEYRISGDFFADFDMFDYPIDRQDLAISMIAYTDRHISMDGVSDGVVSLLGNLEFKGGMKVVSGWREIDSQIGVRPVLIGQNTVGRVRNQGVGAASEFKEISARVTVDRKDFWAFFRIIIPYLFIGLGVLALTFTNIDRMAGLMEISLGLFLAVLSLSLSLVGMTPSINIVAKSDILYLSSFVAALMNFFLITSHHSGILENGSAGILVHKRRLITNLFRVAIFLVLFSGYVVVFIF